MADTLGMRIRVERIRQRLTQKALAHTVGISPNALYAIEFDRSQPTPKHLSALADALGVSTDYLLGRKEIISY